MAGVNIGNTLDTLNTIETGINNNKVVKFAYTQDAYDDNDVNGVTEYDVENENNIPTSAPEVIKVNETVISKGFRNKASSLTRMLMNHMFGRVSYNLNKIHDNFQSLLTVLRQGFHPVYFGTCDTEAGGSVIATGISTTINVTTLPEFNITCSDFVLETGARIFVKFSHIFFNFGKLGTISENKTKTVDVTINVNNTGAKPLYSNLNKDRSSLTITCTSSDDKVTTSIPKFLWKANETVEFMYDGTNWIMMKPISFNLDVNGVLYLEF